VEYRPVSLAANRVLGPGTFVLTFAGCDFLKGALPGQFVMLRGLSWGLDPLLPRAFSLLAVDEQGSCDILIKATGKASRILETAQPGASFSVLGPLGNSFPTPASDREDWLLAGGVGLAPLLMQAQLAHRLELAGQVTFFYGGRSRADLVLLEELRRVTGTLVLTTDDGSHGMKGRVTDATAFALDRREAQASPTLLACGPDPMLEAVSRLAHKNGLPTYLSLEGEMACGVGACLVCAVPCEGDKPYRYACVDGPVFPLQELRGAYAIKDSADTGGAKGLA